MADRISSSGFKCHGMPRGLQFSTGISVAASYLLSQPLDDQCVLAVSHQVSPTSGALSSMKRLRSLVASGLTGFLLLMPQGDSCFTWEIVASD
ncbi:hypothetical protein U0070_013153 [Myodes glareolus]|uniref:Uncharacterized protein n=1 Tax=Myodes glareolus TaxID=447135 RepID=A0AAW0HIR4_MYOGA